MVQGSRRSAPQGLQTACGHNPAGGGGGAQEQGGRPSSAGAPVEISTAAEQAGQPADATATLRQEGGGRPTRSPHLAECRLALRHVSNLDLPQPRRLPPETAKPRLGGRALSLLNESLQQLPQQVIRDSSQ